MYIFTFRIQQDCYLVHILSTWPSSTSMIFTRTCDATRFLALVLSNLGFKAIPISGQMSQVCITNHNTCNVALCCEFEVILVIFTPFAFFPLDLDF